MAQGRGLAVVVAFTTAKLGGPLVDDAPLGAVVVAAGAWAQACGVVHEMDALRHSPPTPRAERDVVAGLGELEAKVGDCACGLRLKKPKAVVYRCGRAVRVGGVCACVWCA